MQTTMTTTMTTMMTTMMAAVLALAAPIGSGCGSGEPCSGSACQGRQDDGDNGDNGSDGGVEPPPAGFKGTCCLDGQYYRCVTEAAFRRCAGPEWACHQKCAADFTCHMACDDEAMNAQHDPSQCARDSSRDGECGSPPELVDCIGSSNGMACTYSTQCPSGYHCASGKCYSDGIGNPCTYSTQCTSQNCTDGCCRATSSGSACTYSTQCSKGLHCTDGTCYSGAKGNPCTYSTECTSQNCTNGRCQ